jgi:hypothetical protein
MSSGSWLRQIKEALSNSFLPVQHTLHDGVTSIGLPLGNIFTNNIGGEVFTFSIGGTSTTQVYEFRTIDHAGNDALVTCYRQSDSEDGTGTSVKGETWHAPIKNIPYFYVKLISLAGGSSIVKGEVSK